MIMKTLILYYSYTGHCRKKALELRAQLGADIERIDTYRKPNKFRAYTVGCFMAMRQRKEDIKPIRANLKAYDKVILVSPVWAGHPATPFNAAVALIPVGKTVDVYMVSASGKSQREKNMDYVNSKGLKLSEYYDVKG
jgi:flavodoxin